MLNPGLKNHPVKVLEQKKEKSVNILQIYLSDDFPERS